MVLDIPENWRPTTANIKALPEPLRRYIHALERRHDPVGDVQTIAILMEQIEELRKLLAHEVRRKDRGVAPFTAVTLQRRFSP